MYRLVDRCYERVKDCWEERFERSYGFWRGFVDEVVLAFQTCGDFEGGFYKDEVERDRSADTELRSMPRGCILDPRVVTKILRHIAEKATARERAPPSSTAVAS